MAATFCEIWRGRGGKLDWTTSRDYDVIYRVVMDTVSTADPKTAAAVLGLDYAEPYGPDPDALLQSFTPLNQNRGREWIIQVHYTTKLDFPQAPGGVPGSTAGDPGSQSSNPADRAAVWTFGSVIKRKARMFDNTGKPLLNTVKQWLTPPYEEDIPLLNIKISKYYAVSAISSVDFFTTYRNTCNNATWHGFPAYQAKVNDVVANSAIIENNYPVYKVDWDIIIDDIDGWHPVKILNAGTVELVNGKIRQITDEFTGLPVGQPFALKSNSRRLLTTDPQSAVHYLEFDLVERTNFSTIPGI